VTALANGFRIVAHLFVDDGAIAIAIAAVVGLSAGVGNLAPSRPILSGVVLLNGCLAALFGSVISAARSRRRTN
jgi:hypothetical protein